MVHDRLFKAAKKTGFAEEKPAEDRLEHWMQIIVVYAVLVMFITWLHTIPVIKLPGTYVGAGIMQINTADKFAAYAVKALEMDLDFIIIDTTNPEIHSLCAQEELIHNLQCYFASGNILNGQELNVCQYPKLGCDAIRVREPKDFERAAISCLELPPSDECLMRAYPLWHRTLFTALAILYFFIVTLSVVFRQESITNKVLKFWRHII